MEVSRVSISSSLLDEGELPQKRKRELREQAIMDYIKRRPYMKPIPTKEFERVGRFNNNPTCHAFLQRMIKERKITKEEVPGSRSYAYIVNAPVRVTKPAKAHGKQPQFTLEEVERAAKEFVWRSESDSLREFMKELVKTIEKGEL